MSKGSRRRPENADAIAARWPLRPKAADVCPHCAADLRGAEIPVDSRQYYAPGETHFSRRIGVEVLGVYDGMLYWRCPDCGWAWQRFDAASSLHEAAALHIACNNAALR